jgi:hypothetical protein
MHAWDAPVETLLAEAPRHGAPLLLPRLGTPVEPAHGPVQAPWWRGVDSVPLPPGQAAGAAPPDPQALPRGVVWPAD